MYEIIPFTMYNCVKEPLIQIKFTVIPNASTFSLVSVIELVSRAIGVTGE